VGEDKILECIRREFDLRPGAIIRDLGLRRPIYRPTAAYGHFGRLDIDAPWEKTDRAEALARGCGLPAPAAK
jgi:S-adenosylmethionine synthetase